MQKIVSPSSRRRAVKSCVEEDLSSAAQACRGMNLARSSFYRPCSASYRSRRMHKEVVKLSEEHPRYGYRFTLAEVRVILESWRVKYNKERLRSSLGYRTPRKFAHRS